MLHARRWKFSAAQRADMWNRWKAGQSLHAIGRALGKHHVFIQSLLARHGGIAPANRRRSRRVLIAKAISEPYNAISWCSAPLPLMITRHHEAQKLRCDSSNPSPTQTAKVRVQ
jgi:hypothetical protein